MFERFKKEKSTDDTPVEMVLRDRDGEPYVGKNGEPVVWGIVGEYAKVVRDAQRQFQDRVLRAAKRGDDITLDQSTQESLERSAAAVVFWRNMEDDQGNPVPCNPKNVAAAMLAGEWIVPQFMAVHKGHSGFFDKSSSASSGT